MKDQLLIRLMRSKRFLKLTQPEKNVELADYRYQKENFHRRGKEDTK